MKYPFIKAHRVQFNMRAMCRMFCVHPSEFYTWMKQPLSHRANEDIRQTIMLKVAWHEAVRSTDTASYTMIFEIMVRPAAQTVW